MRTTGSPRKHENYRESQETCELQGVTENMRLVSLLYICMQFSRLKDSINARTIMLIFHIFILDERSFGLYNCLLKVVFHVSCFLGLTMAECYSSNSLYLRF